MSHRGNDVPNQGAIYFYDISVTGDVDGADHVAMLDYTTEDENVERPLENGRDVTGDGVGDLLAGESHFDAARGAVWVIDHPPDGAGLLGDQLGPITGEQAGDQTALSLSGPGDVNGDGYADILIGAPISAARRGRAYLVVGPITGPTSLSDAAGVLEGKTDEVLGQAVTGLGDFTGDGVIDLGIAAGHDPYVQQEEPGRALVVRGQDFVGQVDRDLALEIGSSQLFDGFGSRLAGPGDVTGDGLADIAVSAYLRDTRGVTFLVPGRDW